MGGGASNLSSTELSMFQQSINQVGQEIKNQVSNVSNQQIDLEQEIIFQNGNSIDPDENLTSNPCIKFNSDANNCLTGCLQSQNISYRSYLNSGKERTTENCNIEYGYDKATANAIIGSDGKCNKALITKVDKDTECLNAYLRKNCENISTYVNQEKCDSDSNINGTFIEKLNPNGDIYFIPTTFFTDTTIPVCWGTDERPCYYTRSNSDYYYCISSAISNITLDSCSSVCEKMKCSQELVEALKPEQPSIVGMDIVITNDASNTMSQSQIAEADVSAQLLSKITNQFQNEITKTISQENSGINFGQFNNSQERTDITQKTVSTVQQSLANSSKNTSVQTNNTKQTIKFINYGQISSTSTCDGNTNTIEQNGVKLPCLEPGPSGKIVITNKSVNNISNQQQAKSVVNALMDSSILNDMKNTYKYTLTQKNAGLDLTAFLMALIIPIIVILLIGAAMVFMGWKFGLQVIKDSFGLVIEVFRKAVSLLPGRGGPPGATPSATPSATPGAAATPATPVATWKNYFVLFGFLAMIVSIIVGGIFIDKAINGNKEPEQSGVLDLNSQAKTIAKNNVSCDTIRKLDFIDIQVWGKTKDICNAISQIFTIPDGISTMNDAKKFIQDKLNEKYPGKFPLLFEYCDDEVVVRINDSIGASFIIKKP